MGCCGDCDPGSRESREPLRHDPDFRGPISKRSCTDIICLFLFVIFLGVWGFVGYLGVKHGNVQKLLAPVDSKGRHCGMDSGVENKNYLVFFDITRCLSPQTPITGCPTQQVCVSQCPSETFVFDRVLTQENFQTLKEKIICVDAVDKEAMTFNEAQQHFVNGQCTRYVLQSEPVLGRCFMNVTELVNNLAEIGSASSHLVGVNETTILSDVTEIIRYEQLSSEIVNDLVQSRWYLLGALFAVVAICFIYILLLRWVVGPVVWTSLIGLIALLGYSLYLCYINYKYYSENNIVISQTNNLKGYAQSIFVKSQTWMVLLVIIAVFILIYVLLLIFLRKRIVIATALIREGSKAVMAVKSTIFFPIIPWIFECAAIAYAVIVFMYLLSIGDSTFKVANFKNDTCDCQGLYTDDFQTCDPIQFSTSCRKIGTTLPCDLAICHFSGFENLWKSIYALHFVNLLAFYWTMFFVSGAADMMLASTFSTWYWTFNKRDVPYFTLSAGVFRTIRYHLGTVAFGSLIIAIIRVIRVILEYIDHKMKKFDNPLSKCVICCCKCFFWCLEKFMKFINKNAYIMCAVHGKNFCRSAYDAFSLIMRNIVRVVVLDKVTDFIFFFSKLLISIGVGFGVYFLLEAKFVYDITKGETLHHNYVPAVILFIATYLISTIFFNVYAMAVDTLFLCFLEDCERNDGSPERKYFMSKNLMKILGKRNKRD